MVGFSACPGVRKALMLIVEMLAIIHYGTCRWDLKNRHPYQLKSIINGEDMVSPNSKPGGGWSQSVIRKSRETLGGPRRVWYIEVCTSA